MPEIGIQIFLFNFEHNVEKMNIEIQFVDLKNSSSTEELVREKLLKLGQKYSWITTAAVFFKSELHAEAKNNVCEIRLSVPGPQLFASENETSFEKALNGVIHQLEIQLEKHKSKLHSH